VTKKKQIPLVVVIAPALLIVAAVGYFLLVKPKQDDAAKKADEIAALETQIEVALAAQREPQREDPSAIKVADLFQVTKAMPDDEDIPGIILELNSVAAAAGVEFVSISPQGGAVRGNYTALPINLTFEGNYFDLTDFIFRLRNLVSVRDGKLDAQGRLFTLDTLSMAEGPDSFPEIAAALTVTAYVYATAPPPAPVAPPAADGSTTGTTDTTGTTTAPAEGEVTP
jgi:type IV pilus assembly protein PilO